MQYFTVSSLSLSHTHTSLSSRTHTHTVCPSLSLVNGKVTYSPTNRDIGSVATHACNTGYRPSPQETRTCTSNNGWDGQDVTCGEFPLKKKKLYVSGQLTSCASSACMDYHVCMHVAVYPRAGSRGGYRGVLWVLKHPPPSAKIIYRLP